MNAVEQVVRHFRSQPEKLALLTVRHGEMSYEQFGELVGRAQVVLRSNGVKAGSSVLLLDFPGPSMFAAVVAIMGLGATCILVEPWMPISHIDHVIRQMKPQAFVANWFGRLWGMRVASVRGIPAWIRSSRLGHGALSPIHAESVDPSTPGMIAFSSGTSGKPKGVVRTQGYLLAVHEILTEGGKRDPFPEPDLAVFPNIGLFHITTGRGTMLVPHGWSKKSLRYLSEAAVRHRPATLSCGPAFLLKLYETFRESGGDRPGFDTFRSMYVGGALTDCWILEEAFKRWPSAYITHIYGGTEAEPVSHGDARESVRLSRERGHFQTLHLGRPIPQIAYQLEADGAWISGANVCPEYMGAEEDNRILKRRDSKGVLWHFMGDRLREEQNGFWYAGRSFQTNADFALEQKIYSELQSSACFVHRLPSGDAILVGEGVKKFPGIARAIEGKTVRDRRHRARIDRKATLKKAGIAI